MLELRQDDWFEQSCFLIVDVHLQYLELLWVRAAGRKRVVGNQ
jgi:hypothetical protein